MKDTQYSDSRKDSKDITLQYDNFAEEFSSASPVQNRVNIVAFHTIIDFPLKGRKLLDLGCGDGADLKLLESRGAEVYGLDASKEMINFAKQKLPNANLKVGLFENIPFDSNLFDVVVSKYALQASYDLGVAFKEISRTLKSDGIFVCLVTHPLRQFLEKKKKGKDYFKKEVVKSILFGTSMVVEEPTHTFNEYFDEFFFRNFELVSFKEMHDPAAEAIDEDIYPGFFILKARKK